MISKTNLARFQGKVFLLGTIVIAVLILWSLFGTASGAFHLQQLSSLPDPQDPVLEIPIGGSGCIQGFVQVGLECVRDSNVPISDIFGVISILMDIPFQLLMTIAVLIIAVIIAIPIILIVRRKSN